MSAYVVIGLQWGDEGKGKIIDAISAQFSHVARGQGGHNAGHTVITENKEYHFHLMPSAILWPNCKCYIGAGVVIYPEQLLREIQSVNESLKNKLFISPYAHLILPKHIELDETREEELKKESIGTTKRGIGPCYTSKVSRQGLKISEMLSKECDPKGYFASKEDYESYFDQVKELQDYIAPVEQLLYRALMKQEKILLEGAQGSLLDVQFGTYPYVTSSNTTAAGLCSGVGIGPSKIKSTLGILKAYQTRVGNGPFPTELSEEESLIFPDVSITREVGTTTGRKRRIGWLDLMAAKFAVEINGVNELAVTKLDILSKLDSIKVCVAYEINGEEYKLFPFRSNDLKRVRPIYKELKGWKCDISQIMHYKDLPQNAKEYLDFIQYYLRIPITIISNGPSREQLIKKAGEFLV